MPQDIYTFRDAFLISVRYLLFLFEPNENIKSKFSILEDYLQFFHKIFISRFEIFNLPIKKDAKRAQTTNAGLFSNSLVP